MPLIVQLQDENGNVISEVIDQKGYFAKLLPAIGDNSFYCLRFIDVSGDTSFNRGQMSSLISELDRVFKNVQNTEEAEIYNQIRVLATRCQEEVHLYLKFYGD